MKDSTSRIFKYFCYILAGSVAVGYVLVFGIAFFVPLYVDEVAEKIASSRLLQDGPYMLSVMPQCGESNLALPYSWLPGRLILSLIHIVLSSPFLIRVGSVLFFLSWLGIISRFIYSYVKEQEQRLFIIIAIIAYCSLGVLPLVLMTSRVEQPILLGVTFFCMIALLMPKIRSHILAFVMAVIVLLSISVFFSLHPKTLLFSPLIILCVTLFARALPSHALRGIVLATLIITLIQSLHIWSAWVLCKEAPLLGAELNKEALNFYVLEHDPHLFIQRILTNIIRTYKYFYNILFLNSYVNKIFIPSYVPTIISRGMLNTQIILFFSWGALFGAILMIKCIIIPSIEKKTFQPRHLVALFLLAAMGCLWLVQISKNIHESALMLPLFSLYFIVLLPDITSRYSKKAGISFMVLLYILALQSQFSVVSYFSYYLKGEQQKILIKTQYLSQIWQDSWVRNTKITRAASLCKISATGNLNHLVVDDYTYFTFMHSYQPYHIFFISSDKWGADIGEQHLLDFLKERHSSGIVTQCYLLPPTIRQLAVQYEDICCLKP